MLHGEAKPQIFRNAQMLRKRMTSPEKILWASLKDKKFLNLKFRRQHPFGKFIFDFYCFEFRIAIELDGKSHETPEQKKRDSWRTLIVSGEEVSVFRIPNKEITDDVDETLHKLKLKLTPLLQERGGRRPG